MSQQVGGVYFFEKYLDPREAEEAYNVMDSDFPWNLAPTLYGERLTQHAYEYDRYDTKSNKKRQAYAGLAHLEQLCQKLEQDFDGKIDYVFCNRFQDPMHCIPWHKDVYGRHITILSLGSSRKVQFRSNKTKEIETIEPSSGDLYFMPLRLNDSHKHRVCGAEQDNAGTRLSFVFFFKPPKYAKEFKITRMDKLKGRFTELTGIGA